MTLLPTTLKTMKPLATLTALCLATTLPLTAASIYDIPLKDIDGHETSLAPQKGKVMLIVNVASKCGFTKQYKELEKVYEAYSGKGLTVLGFPCNQFGNQEPGTNEEIKQFCTETYDVTFPMFAKIEVNGDGRNALYDLLAGSQSPFPGDIKWNFTKFLVSRDGTILKRFESSVKPDAPEVIAAINAALAEN